VALVTIMGKYMSSLTAWMPDLSSHFGLFFYPFVISIIVFIATIQCKRLTNWLFRDEEPKPSRRPGRPTKPKTDIQKAYERVNRELNGEH